MSVTLQVPQGAVQARLSRFALCIAPSSDTVFDVIERVLPHATAADEAPMREAYRLLLQELDGFVDDLASVNAPPPPSIVARFSYLPYHQRVAFALVVIEEFSIDDTAEIMDLGVDDVRSLLMATRDFLFSARLSTRSDA
ncbi:MAG: sigma factor-like helix-turn-helix DNA-binding protein [Pseudomonadota bacterium]